MFWGYLVLLVSGLCQGSFGLGYKKYHPLSWEAFWGVYCLFCLLVTSIWTFSVEPDMMKIILASDFKDFIVPFLCGMAWGLSTIAFSKSVLMVGISLCFGVNMGTSAVVGSVIPFFTSGRVPSVSSIALLLVGAFLTIVGVGIITKAGILKDKSKKSSNAVLGVVLAFVSGLCSGIMNIGFDKASPLGSLAPNYIAASAVQWFPVLCGGTIAAMIVCAVLLFKNKSWNTFSEKGSPKRILAFAVTSVVWFAALALYGISTKMIGDAGSSIGWLIFNAIALIVSNFWGIRCGEWDNCVKERKLLFVGDLILLISWVLIVFV